MMLIGRLFKEGSGWSAHCDVAGVWTQGPTRKIAIENLGEAIELRVDHEGFRASVTEIGPDGDDAYAVLVDSDQPAILAGGVLRYQRERHGLSRADITRRLGPSDRAAYASYERGLREPTLSKFEALLAMIAPEIALVIRPKSNHARRARKVAR